MANKRNGLSWETKNGLSAPLPAPNRKPAATEKGEEGQIQDVVGHFGYYQLLIFLFKILIGVTSAYNNLSVTFFAPSSFISFQCLSSEPHSSQLLLAGKPPLASSNSSLDVHFHQDAHLNSINNNLTLNNNNDTQPIIIKHLSNENLFHDFLFSEERRKRNQIGFSTDTPKNLVKECKYYSQASGSNETCKSFKYNTGIWISTIVDEWDLVCDRSWFISMTQSLYMSGFILSFLFFGYLSDRFGRWRSLLFGALIEVMSGFGCAFAPSVTWFMIFRFLLGIGNAGRTSTSYLIMIEWCGPKWRMHVSTLGSLGWVIGYCSMPWTTLFFRHFRHVQLFVCFYESLFIIWLFWLPESPRWLLTHKKFDRAYEVLLGAAKFNGLIKKKEEEEQDSASFVKSNGRQIAPAGAMEMSNQLELGAANGQETTTSNNQTLKPMTIEQFDVKFRHLVTAIESKDFTKNENKLNIVDLFRWPNLRKYAFILYFAWASNSFIYYGIVLRVGDFGGTNLFKTFTIAGLTELPSIAFTILCMKMMPRKTTNLFIFITTGLLCALQLPLKYYNYQWLQQSTILLAKLFNSCSFTVILYQTMELFPTSIRQTAFSSCSVAGRIGSILAPFVKELAQATNDSVPPVIYVVLSAIAAFIITDIPETKGMDLPDTLLEAEKMDNKLANAKKLASGAEVKVGEK